MVFDDDLHHDVLKLDVHHGSHRLLLGPHQRGAEDHSQVGHGHQVLVAVRGHSTHTHTDTHISLNVFEPNECV